MNQPDRLTEILGFNPETGEPAEGKNKGIAVVEDRDKWPKVTLEDLAKARREGNCDTQTLAIDPQKGFLLEHSLGHVIRSYLERDYLPGYPFKFIAQTYFTEKDGRLVPFILEKTEQNAWLEVRFLHRNIDIHQSGRMLDLHFDCRLEHAGQLLGFNFDTYSDLNNGTLGPHVSIDQVRKNGGEIELLINSQKYIAEEDAENKLIRFRRFDTEGNLLDELTFPTFIKFEDVPPLIYDRNLLENPKDPYTNPDFPWRDDEIDTTLNKLGIKWQRF